MDEYHDTAHLSLVVELLEKLEQELLTVEELLDTPTDITDLVHRIFRTAHNLKSSLGFMHREASSALVHAIESNFDAVRNGYAKPSALLVHTALLAVDALRYNLFLPGERNDELYRLRRELEAIAQTERRATKEEYTDTLLTLNEQQKDRVHQSIARGWRIMQLDKVITPRGMSRETYEHLPVYDDIREVGVHIATFPAFENIPHDAAEIVIRILFATSLSDEELSLHIFDPVRPVGPRAILGNTLATEGTESLELQNDVHSQPTRYSAVPPVLLPTCQTLRTLIVEDDFISRTIITEIMLPFGTCDVATNGHEAIVAFENALKQGKYYTLVCLDIMMPGMDGTAVLEHIRALEYQYDIVGNARAKVIMTTALNNIENVFIAFRLQCDAYLVKPITKSKILHQLRMLHVIEYFEC
ncbi:MAG: response regulator [Bacteroidota bacterium]|nr:response regulator [Candidatus Kapabacteria bacterium]MDW8219865.1 response regulator [Bacteroidota bacterium]